MAADIPVFTFQSKAAKAAKAGPVVSWHYEMPGEVRFQFEYYCFMHQIPRRHLIRDILAAELSGKEIKPLALPGGFPESIGVWKSYRDNLQVPADREAELLVKIANERTSRRDFIVGLLTDFLRQVEKK